MANKSFLKLIRDKMPETLKYIAAPIFRNRLIMNKEFCKFYALLESRELLDKRKIEEFQFTNLKNILIYSFVNVPYYHELFKKISFDPYKFSDFEQIKKIPFLTRGIVINNYDKLKSRESVKNGYYTGKTGGTTGIPMKFLLDYDSIFKENAFVYYYRMKSGYNFNDKVVSFRQFAHVDRLWRFNPMHNELIFYPIKISKKTVAIYAQKLNEYNPHYLNGYLSSIWYLAKLITEYQIELTIKLKGIFLVSENIDQSQRQFIEKFYNVKSYTFYGHSERCVIAEEVIQNKYVFDPYYGYTEQVHYENNNYSIVGTGFLNYIMPFIRYKTDDICSVDGQYFSIYGKRSSSLGLYGYNNEFITTSAIFLGKEVFKNITNFQFIQNELGKADLLIIVNNSFQLSEMEKIKNELNRQTKYIIDLNVKIVDNLILSSSGKYQLFISKL